MTESVLVDEQLDRLREEYADMAAQFLNAVGMLKQVTAALERSQEEKRKLEKKMYTDPLTGVYNTKFLEEYDFSSKKKVGVLDLIGLKKVNDEKGHSLGNRFIQSVTKCVQKIIRQGDIIRFGGDEFLVVVPKDTDLEGMLHRVNRELKKHRFRIGEQTVSPQIRFGVVSGKRTLKSILDEADRQMYQMTSPSIRKAAV